MYKNQQVKQKLFFTRMNSRRSSNVGCFFAHSQTLPAIFRIVLVFRAQRAGQAKDKQAQDYEPACGHK
jgi:hypothetical protein